MTLQDIGSAASVLGVFITAGGVVFIAGKFSEKIRESRGIIDGHGLRITENEKRLGSHDVSIGKLEEWKSGFNAAANISGGQRMEPGDR